MKNSCYDEALQENVPDAANFWEGFLFILILSQTNSRFKTQTIKSSPTSYFYLHLNANLQSLLLVLFDIYNTKYSQKFSIHSRIVSV